ncbi:MAG TPA: trigger factor [Candidatus Dormibacteraeota bacterium]|nr:trigger factor [Candidatus Dormibacteraeota bacterium]
MTPSVTDAPELEVEIERLPGSEAKLTVVAPIEEVDRAISRALRQLSGQIRLPGFRPGKAPASVVERAVGWSAVQHEAVDILLPELYERAVRQAELDPVAQPRVGEAELERGTPFRFVATVGIRPDVTLGDYHDIRVAVARKDVADEDISGTLEALRQRYAQLIDAGDRGVQAGDVVTADLTMRHGDDVVGTPGQAQTLDLERGELLPGMAEQLLGATVGGDPVEITLTLPEEYAREELRGELVVITAEVTRIQAKELPALDDNLAAIAGHGETLEELRDFIREQIASEQAVEADRDQANAVMEALLGIAKMEVPEAMIQAEIDNQVQSLERRLAEAGLTLEALLQAQGSSLEQLRGERRQAAVESVRLDLALGEVAKREGISITDTELKVALAEILPKGTSAAARDRLGPPIRRELAVGRARELLIGLASSGETAPSAPEG